MNPLPKTGFFITFEGTEGCGKSTQAKLLAEDLERLGHRVLLTRDPGGCPLAEELRRLLKHFGSPEDVCPEAELLMFGAGRAQLTTQVILPHLAGGGVVVSDRFADSTTVYQGAARGLNAEFIAAMHRFTFGGRWPDITFLLDAEAATTLRRATARAPESPHYDRIEAEEIGFHEAVRNGFLQLAKADPDRFHVLDATLSIDRLRRRIREDTLDAMG